MCHSNRRTSGTVWGSSSALRSRPTLPPERGLAQDGEIGVRQHGEGDVAMPADPGAHLVLVEPDLAICGFEARLDGPARAGYLRQLGERRRFVSRARVR
jgi:hypothetical protein